MRIFYRTLLPKNSFSQHMDSSFYNLKLSPQKVSIDLILLMNQSFDSASNGYHLPRIPQNESSYLRTSKGPEMIRSMSQHQPTKSGKANLTRKLVMMEDIKSAEEYQSMNEKELLREHEKLLRVLKKFQEIIDINLQKKQKEREKGSKPPQSSRQDIFNAEAINNKKIIQNYQKELKELQGLKKCRKLHEVIEEKSQVQNSINKLKKEIFSLKNEDNMAGRSLVADRGIIEKELKEHEKDLKIQLVKKQDYQKKLEDLNNMLAQLKKDCQGINISEIGNQKSHNEGLAHKLAQKKQQLQEVTRVYVNYQQGIQENMVAKAKRNKNIAKQVENCDKKIVQLNSRIQRYKEKVTRYQQAMEILPKDASK